MAEKFSVKKLTTVSLLTAVALIVFVIELQIPPLTSIPGIKLGLANIVSLFAMFWIGRKEAFCILIARILLGSIFTGQGMTLMYSLSGGLLSFAIIALLFTAFNTKALWVPSIISGIFHNVGQLTCAIIVLQTPGLLAYFPVLLISGIVTGLFTGLVAQYLINHVQFLSKPFTD